MINKISFGANPSRGLHQPIETGNSLLRKFLETSFFEIPEKQSYPSYPAFLHKPVIPSKIGLVNKEDAVTSYRLSHGQTNNQFSVIM